MNKKVTTHNFCLKPPIIRQSRAGPAVFFFLIQCWAAKNGITILTLKDSPLKF